MGYGEKDGRTMGQEAGVIWRYPYLFIINLVGES